MAVKNLLKYCQTVSNACEKSNFNSGIGIRTPVEMFRSLRLMGEIGIERIEENLINYSSTLSDEQKDGARIEALIEEVKKMFADFEAQEQVTESKEQAVMQKYKQAS